MFGNVFSRQLCFFWKDSWLWSIQASTALRREFDPQDSIHTFLSVLVSFLCFSPLSAIPEFPHVEPSMCLNFWETVYREWKREYCLVCSEEWVGIWDSHSFFFFCFFLTWHLWLYFLFFGCTRGMWMFPDEVSNLCHSSDLSGCSDHARSLTHCITRELLP